MRRFHGNGSTYPRWPITCIPSTNTDGLRDVRRKLEQIAANNAKAKAEAQAASNKLKARRNTHRDDYQRPDRGGPSIER